MISQTASIYLGIYPSAEADTSFLSTYTFLPSFLPSVDPNGSPDQTEPNQPIRFARQREPMLGWPRGLVLFGVCGKYDSTGSERIG